MSDFAWTFSNCAINVVDATLTVLLPYIVVKQSKIAFLTFMSSVCNIFDVGPIGNYIFYFMAFATTLLLIRQKPLAVIAWTAIFLIAQIVIDVAVNSLLVFITGQGDFTLNLYTQKSPAFIAICLFVKLCNIIFFLIVCSPFHN